jgi:phosphatidylglycerol:prolipoprotein diacylglycerol transferase
MIYALCGGLFGSRIAFVALHIPYYQNNPVDIFAFWQGGLSASGGMLGVLIGLLLYTRGSRRTLWSALDDLSIPALMLSITSWIGCWLDGVAYGRRIDLDWPWLMNSDPFLHQIARFPTQLLGILLSTLTFLEVYRLDSGLPLGVKGLLAGSITALILVIVGLFRADPSMLVTGIRLDVLSPSALAVAGFFMATYRWRSSRT